MPVPSDRMTRSERHNVEPQPLSVDAEAQAETYLADLLKSPKNRSMSVIARRCALRVRDPKIKAFFLTAGAKMLAEMKA